MYLSLCNPMQTCGKLQCEDAMCNYFATKIANFRKIKVVFTYCTNLIQNDTQASVNIQIQILYEFHDGKVWKI